MRWGREVQAAVCARFSGSRAAHDWPSQVSQADGKQLSNQSELTISGLGD